MILIRCKAKKKVEKYNGGMAVGMDKDCTGCWCYHMNEDMNYGVHEVGRTPTMGQVIGGDANGGCNLKILFSKHGRFG